MQNRRLSVRTISEDVGVSVGSVDTILTVDLKIHKIWTKIVPKIFSKDQR